jgi:hypothetical protein
VGKGQIVEDYVCDAALMLTKEEILLLKTYDFFGSFINHCKIAVEEDQLVIADKKAFRLFLLKFLQNLDIKNPQPYVQLIEKIRKQSVIFSTLTTNK